MTTALIIAASVIGYLLAGGVTAGLMLRLRRRDPRDAPSPWTIVRYVAVVWPLVILVYGGAFIIGLGIRAAGARKSDLGGGA